MIILKGRQRCRPFFDGVDQLFVGMYYRATMNTESLQPTPSTTYSQVTYTPEPPRQSSKKGLIAVIVAIVFVLVGVGSVAAYFYLVNSPEKKIENALLHLENMKSIEYEGEIKVSVDASSSSQTQVSDKGIFSEMLSVDPLQAAGEGGRYELTMRGQSDLNDKANPASALAFGARINVPNQPEYMFDGQGIVKDKKVYVKLNSLPNLGMDLTQLDLFKGKWIAIPEEASNYSMLGVATNPSTSSFGSLRDASGAAKLRENQETIKLIYAKHRFMKFDTSNPDEVIDGKTAVHYVVRIDPVVFKQFLTEVYPIITDSAIPEYELQTLDEPLALIGKTDFHLWLDKKDDYLYKFETIIRIDDKEMSAQSGSVAISARFKNYNMPMNITAPTDAKTIEEITQEYMQTMQNDSSSSLMKKSRDSVRLTDLVTLRKAIDATIATTTIVNLPVCRGAKTNTACSSIAATESATLRDAKGKGWIKLDLSSYLATLPVDPLNGQTMINSAGEEVVAGYFFRSDGTDYKIATYLEDPDNVLRVQQDGGSDPELFETGSEMSNRLGL